MSATERWFATLVLHLPPPPPPPATAATASGGAAAARKLRAFILPPNQPQQGQQGAGVAQLSNRGAGGGDPVAPGPGSAGLLPPPGGVPLPAATAGYVETERGAAHRCVLWVRGGVRGGAGRGVEERGGAGRGGVRGGVGWGFGGMWVAWMTAVST